MFTPYIMNLKDYLSALDTIGKMIVYIYYMLYIMMLGVHDSISIK